MKQNAVWPKVSVMVITYNQRHLIDETLESVLTQNYQSFEIIVADDGSTDGSREVILEYQQRYPNIVVPILNERNVGITGNSNAAFFACSGELIAILGGDDLFLPGKLRAQAQQFIDNPQVVLSYHPVEIFQSQTNKTLFVSHQLPRENIHNVYDLIEKGGIAGASSVMVRRSACPSTGFDSRLPVVSDWMFFIEVAMNGDIAKLNGVYGRYRKHGVGASDSTYALLEESLSTLQYIQEKHPHNPRLATACQRGAARYLAGEVYRQVGKDVKIALTLARRMLQYDQSPRYRILSIVVRTMARWPFITHPLTRLLNLSKYLLKKIAG